MQGEVTGECERLIVACHWCEGCEGCEALEVKSARGVNRSTGERSKFLILAEVSIEICATRI